jgi:hypothetical protein
MIEVQPTARLLRDFARWATAQTPKVRTVSQHAFAVPAELFGDIPEYVLVGALVDGQRYASPHDWASAELLGVATPAGFAPTDDPEADAAAMVDATPPDFIDRTMTAVRLATDLAASNAARGELADDEHDQAGGDGDTEPYACDLCPRTFATERGRDTHRRQAHPTED